MVEHMLNAWGGRGVTAEGAEIIWQGVWAGDWAGLGWARALLSAIVDWG